jgi:AraC family transcriptional regulator
MKPATLQDYKQRLLRVLVHIQQNLDGELGLDELARLASFSPFHFHRVFRGMIGESLQGHIRRLRLERAARQLKTGRQPVTRIALDAGFEAPGTFSRAFRSRFGATPTHYRSRRREPEDGLRAPSGIHFSAGDRLRDFQALPARTRETRVAVHDLPPQRVAFVHHIGPYATCGQAWEKLCARLGRDGWLGGDSQFIGICHDDPEVTPPACIRYDACITVGADFRPLGEIGVQTVAGGAYAIATHFGPYETLGDTYCGVLGRWLPRSGRELRSLPSFEVYLTDPDNTEPSDRLTDIHVPLEP